MAHDVFVSYVNEDQTAADEIVEGLEKAGLRCWYAQRDVPPGVSWMESIQNAIKSSRFMVVVFSAKTDRSARVVHEVELADVKGVMIIPFRIEDIEPTGKLLYFFSTRHLLDAFSPPLGQHIEKLERMIRAIDQQDEVTIHDSMQHVSGKKRTGWFQERQSRPIIPSQRAIMPVRSGSSSAPLETPRMDGGTGSTQQPVHIRATEILGADPVDFSVMAPQKVTCGQMFLLQVFLHTPDEAEAARALALEFDPMAKRLGTSQLEVDLLPGSVIMVELYLPGMEIDEPVQRLTWKSRTTSIQFGVSVPTDARQGPLLGRLVLHHDGIPVGSLRFKLDVSPKGAGPSLMLQQLEGAPQRYQEAFISYSSQDRSEVLKRVQMLDRFHIRFFQDVLNLEPGTRWEQELYRHIDTCDLFLLFWSSASKASEWVDKEVQYALARRKESGSELPEIVPILIEGPPVPLPPEYLAHLHFNDRLLYFMEKP
jgi:hypothetical protein